MLCDNFILRVSYWSYTDKAEIPVFYFKESVIAYSPEDTRVKLTIEVLVIDQGYKCISKDGDGAGPTQFHNSY